MKNSKIQKNNSNIIIPKMYNYLAVFLSMACPRGCKYCMNNQYGKVYSKKIVSGKKWVKALNKLETDLPITLHGGEPLTHPDFFYILKNLKPTIKTDLLTTFPFGVKEFIKKANPERFTRNLPYSSIRITHHFDSMKLEQTIDDAITLREHGFDASINLVDLPWKKELVNITKKEIESKNILCVVKPYLGKYEGKTYGLYKYENACTGESFQKVNCRTSNLLISEIGDVYKCHYYLFKRAPEGIVGNIFSKKFLVPTEFRPCTNFGSCIFCDIQTKYDRFGKFGFCSTEIKGKNVKENSFQQTDWR